MTWNNPSLIDILKGGGVVVMPTDTIYGIVGRAESNSTVERIYSIKKRTPAKPSIILINDIGELKNFSIDLSEKEINALRGYWPASPGEGGAGPTSVVLDCPGEKFAYLHRGTQTLAFRMPYSEELRQLIMRTGPLIAPSANPEGLPPARNLEEAKGYFGDSVDMYMDGGEINGKASRLVKLRKDGSVVILRE